MGCFMTAPSAREGLTWYEPIGGLIVLLGAAIGQQRLKIFNR